MKKRFFYFFIVLVIILIIFWYFNQRVVISTIIDSNATITGDYTIEEGERVIIKDGSILTIAGNLVVRGEIVCEEGPLTLVINGDALIENKLECDRGDQLEEGDIGEGISLVVKNSLTLTEKAKLITNGHVQIVEDLDSLTKNQDKIDSLYEDVARDTGEGNRLGPFIKKEKVSVLYLEKDTKIGVFQFDDYNKGKTEFSLLGIPRVYAAGPMINISGEIIIRTPPRKVKQIIIFNLPNASGFHFKDFWLIGPNGRKGEDDKNKSCNAKGRDGQNAMRLFVRAPNIKINDFTFELGIGGDGGEAETKENECQDAKAVGGDGGKAGNFKIIASKNFDILGKFTIYPGRSGNGGGAIAYGKKGDPTKDGGDATARGGDAENNEKVVRSMGTVNGKANIFFGSMEGGSGGSALAAPGNGGDGRACKSERGGNGGDGIAEGGKGGDALIFLAGGGAGRTNDAEDIGGEGGFVQIIPARGGNGSTCKPDRPGGNGGNGGDSKATAGKGGKGGTKNGQDGKVHNEAGGDGGDGGDGCPEGVGGIFGIGNPVGQNGRDGANICPKDPEKKTETTVGGSGGALDEVDIEIIPLKLIFEHEIGFSPCPQKIGDVTVGTKGEGKVSGWKLQGSPPNWLNMPISGALGEIELNFSCILDQYISQELSSILSLQLVDSEGNPISKSSALNVTGYINAQ